MSTLFELKDRKWNSKENFLIFAEKAIPYSDNKTEWKSGAEVSDEPVGGIHGGVDSKFGEMGVNFGRIPLQETQVLVEGAREFWHFCEVIPLHVEVLQKAHHQPKRFLFGI